MNDDDARLMQRVQNGEHEPFARLMDRYWSALCRVADSKLGDRTLAEDLVQETFLAVYAARHTYRPDFAFRTWLWTILLNLCKRHYARRSRAPRQWSRDDLASQMTCSLDEPVSHEDGLSRLLQQEQQGLIRGLLDQLPEPQADALRLRFYGELSFPEIASTMNSSLSGAKVRVRKGLETLAGWLSKTSSLATPPRDAQESSHELR